MIRLIKELWIIDTSPIVGTFSCPEEIIVSTRVVPDLGKPETIIGFDTFEGFRSIDSEHDPEDISEDDFKVAGTLDTLHESISLYDMNRPISHMSRCKTVKGDAVETIPEYVKLHPEMTISLLYLDFDLYKPTLVALQNLLPLVCKGGIVALDEFNYDKFAGETAALKEVLDINNIKLERFTYAPFVAFFER